MAQVRHASTTIEPARRHRFGDGTGAGLERDWGLAQLSREPGINPKTVAK